MIYAVSRNHVEDHARIWGMGKDSILFKGLMSRSLIMSDEYLGNTKGKKWTWDLFLYFGGSGEGHKSEEVDPGK